MQNLNWPVILAIIVGVQVTLGGIGAVVAALAPNSKAGPIILAIGSDLGKLTEIVRSIPGASKALGLVAIFAASMIAAACIRSAAVESPTPGVYCIAVQIEGVPGSELVCYDTAAERAAVRAAMKRSGCKIDGLDRAACPGTVLQ